MPPSDRLFTPRFAVMCGFNFVVFLSAFQLLPTAPFQIRALGGSAVAAGLFLGFLTYASAMSGPITGGIADRVGKRRVLMTSSLALAAFSAIYAVLPSYVPMLALVVVHGGGPQISSLMDRLGKTPEFRNGLRVTDAETVDMIKDLIETRVRPAVAQDGGDIVYRGYRDGTAAEFLYPDAFVLTDGSGNNAQQTVAVTVPHDEGK